MSRIKDTILFAALIAACLQAGFIYGTRVDAGDVICMRPTVEFEELVK